jgi:hypothetical protein
VESLVLRLENPGVWKTIDSIANSCVPTESARCASKHFFRAAES